jgi:trehalose 6-phosphate phosphatase
MSDPGQTGGQTAEERLAAFRARPAEAALCLDFDGTLAPIVDDPEAAAPLPGTVELLTGLAERFAAVALVSGRPAAFLAERAPAPGVRYVGLYGLEVIRDGEVSVAPEIERYRESVEAALRELATHPAVTGAGAYLEHKGLAVGVHLRRVADPARWSGPLEEAARDVAATHDLTVAPGRLVWELRPPVAHDKGDALRQVLEASGATLAMMVGDDRGDLPAFEALRALRGTLTEALTVAVRSQEVPPELLAAADVIVDGPEGVHALLRELLAPVVSLGEHGAQSADGPGG